MHRNTERFDGLCRKLAMARAGNLIQDHARDAHARIEARAAFNNGGRCLRLPTHIDHEQDRPAKRSGDIGGRACPALFSRNAVEKSHHPFAQDEAAALGTGNGQRLKKWRTHRPAVEIEALSARRGGMESGVDIIRPDLAPLTASPRRASARSSPAVTVVLPAPERAAPTISAGAGDFLVPPFGSTGSAA